MLYEVITDGSGTIWFATGKGVVRTDPTRWSLDRSDIPVRMESVSYTGPNGRDHVMDNLGGEVRLTPGSMNLRLIYTALDLRAAEKVRFRYRLVRNGVEVAVITSYSIHYTKLYDLFAPIT